jgi:plastocyanin
MKRPALVLGLVALAAVLAACSGASAAPSAPPASAPAGGTGTTVTVVAKDTKFQTTALAVKAGEAFDLVLDNQDSAPHNIKISDASGAEVFKGEIVTSTKVDNAVPALEVGTYTFICEVHQDMQGTITAQ